MSRGISKLKLQHHKTKLTHEFKPDLAWWSTSLKVFNRKDIIPRPRDMYVASMDTCDQSCGVACGPDWTYISWGLDFLEGHMAHINYKEVLLLLLLLFAVRQ